MKLTRRHLLVGLSAATVAGVAACTGDSLTPPGPASPSAPPSAIPSSTPSALPFDLEIPSTVEAVIFDGAFGTGYVRLAAEQLMETHDGVTVTVLPSDDLNQDLSDRFEDGVTPPDLIDNSGAGKLRISTLADEFEELDDLIEEVNLQGEPIGETLYHGTLESGTYNGRLIGINYALSVFGLWHSAPTFAREGWAVPTTWDDMLLLGEDAARSGRHLMVWGERAEAYYQELAITSAIKEGGHEVRLALDNLEPDGWAHPAVAMVLEQLELCVAEGFILEGGPYLEAQAKWSRDGAVLLYPAGSWIAREMGGTAPANFGFTVAPVPTLTAAPALPIAAIHSAPTEQFLVPKEAANPAGGKELLRVLLSKDAAEAFARTNLIPTVVRGSVPADVESTSLASQTALLADAGEHVFDWRFTDYYGLGEDTNEVWGRFLRGRIGASELAERMQALTDAVREDPTVDRYTAD